MTVDHGKLLFGAEVEPLPLLNTTVAASRLGLGRHSLACYRSLGTGPAWYKFGKWIRYLPADLDAWLADRINLPNTRLQAAPDALDPSLDRVLIDTPSAARFLTVSRFCLYNYRKERRGPPLRRFGRRIYYAVGDLRAWAEQQRQ